jgi:hypothetical protein
LGETGLFSFLGEGGLYSFLGDYGGSLRGEAGPRPVGFLEIGLLIGFETGLPFVSSKLWSLVCMDTLDSSSSLILFSICLFNI